MASVKVKVRQPFHRVKILKAKDAFLDDVEIFVPLDTIPDDDIIEKLDEFDEDLEEEVPEPAVFINQFSFCNPKRPILISLDKIPPKSIPVDEVKKEVQKAYDNGFDDGQQVTTSNFEAEIEKYRDWIKRIDSVVEDLTIGYHVEVNKFEDSLTSLAKMMAEHILEREISQDSEVVITQARKAIDSLDEDKIFRIRINPEDMKALEDAKSRLTPDQSVTENIVLSPDESIEKGGCILETSAGTVDARISKQLEKLENALKNVVVNESANDIEQDNAQE
jgi:flagellar biosynthesis/type III secretory pathway protein FliH